MIDRRSRFPTFPRAAAMASLLALGAGLSGCAGLGDGVVSGAFVDPAKYNLFDCQQLEVERRTLASRTAELQGLIDKAQTGTAGSVVGELAYRNDYISARASSKLAEENWQRSKCVETAPAILAPAAGSPAARKRSGSAAR
ncbi:MAG: twin-arginine translocation pathway signal [Tardiphaga sp.]